MSQAWIYIPSVKENWQISVLLNHFLPLLKINFAFSLDDCLLQKFKVSCVIVGYFWIQILGIHKVFIKGFSCKVIFNVTYMHSFGYINKCLLIGILGKPSQFRLGLWPGWFRKCAIRPRCFCTKSVIKPFWLPDLIFKKLDSLLK